jgi:hypothetical protein
LNPYQLQIDNWLRTSPHITASRIGALLREQCGELVIRERALRYFVANRRRALIPREAFIRAVYTPGAQAQFDFTPVSVNLAGVLVVLQLFVMRLSYSGRLLRGYHGVATNLRYLLACSKHFLLSEECRETPSLIMRARP